MTSVAFTIRSVQVKLSYPSMALVPELIDLYQSQVSHLDQHGQNIKNLLTHLIPIIIGEKLGDSKVKDYVEYFSFKEKISTTSSKCSQQLCSPSILHEG